MAIVDVSDVVDVSTLWYCSLNIQNNQKRSYGVRTKLFHSFHFELWRVYDTGREQHRRRRRLLTNWSRLPRDKIGGCYPEELLFFLLFFLVVARMKETTPIEYVMRRRRANAPLASANFSLRSIKEAAGHAVSLVIYLVVDVDVVVGPLLLRIGITLWLVAILLLQQMK